MKSFLTSLIFLFGTCFFVHAQGNVGIGTSSPDSSAILDLHSIDQGLLIPRLTTEQIDSISSPAIGLQVFCLDDNCIQVYDGIRWLKNCAVNYDNISTTPPATSSWRAIAPYPKDVQAAVSFTINNVAYVGSGITFEGYTNEFYKYDAATNAWTPIANCPSSLAFAVAFTIGGKGYVGTGYNDSNDYSQDFYKYDPDIDEWTTISSFPGSPRNFATAFAIGDEGYVGTGVDSSLTLNNDFYKYNAVTDTWSQVADFIGSARWFSSSFVINNIAYVGLGADTIDLKEDFYKYDATSNTWSTIADFPAGGRYRAVSFENNEKGYIGLGLDTSFQRKNDFFQYDPTTNTWTSFYEYTETPRSDAIAFIINNEPYVGTGHFNIYLKDIHRLSLDKYTLTRNTDGQTMWSSGKSIYEVLAYDNDANNKMIKNLLNPQDPQDAATKDYVDSRKLRNILWVDNEAYNTITRLDPPIKYNDAATKGYVDNSVSAISSLQAIISLGNFAGWKTITGLAEPMYSSDAATKSYVDTKSTLSQILAYSNNAANNTITGLAEPINNSHAATKQYVDTKSTLSEILAYNNNAENNTITGLAIPTNPSDAANKYYVDDQVNNWFNLSTILGNGNNANDIRIYNLGEPLSSSDAVTKNYVDNHVVPEAENQLPLNINWSNYGSPFKGCKYYKHQGRVYIEGLIEKASTVLAGDNIATLPVGYRPAERILVNAMHGNEFIRVDIHPNGEMEIITIGSSSSYFVNLTGTSFRID